MADPIRCSTEGCERPADVLLPFPANVPAGFPAQVFPVCGACANLGPALEEWIHAGTSVPDAGRIACPVCGEYHAGAAEGHERACGVGAVEVMGA